MVKMLIDNLLGFIFDKVWNWGKPIITIAALSLMVKLLAAAHHPLLHEPAIIFLVILLSLAGTLSAIVSIQRFLEKQKNNQNF